MGKVTRTSPTIYYDHDPYDAYGYKDTSEDGQVSLVLNYDMDRSSHENTYDIPTTATRDIN